MGKFDGILICTDLDGTLLRNDGTISLENISAIEFFKSEGGTFTFVTGRMPFYTSDFYNAVKPNAPFGCVNGGGLYDYIAEKYIWMCPMKDDAVELIRCVDNKFPDVGIQVNTFYKTYFCKENPTMENFRKATKLDKIVCDYTEINEPIAKVIFGSESNEEILEIEKNLLSHPMAEKFDFVRSERTLFEILPKGSGKGCAVKKLCEYLNIDINKTVAIGDYNNDISMLQAARLGIAVSNACPDVLKAADRITVSNEEHAIQKVINDLNEKIYTLE